MLFIRIWNYLCLQRILTRLYFIVENWSYNDYVLLKTIRRSISLQSRLQQQLVVKIKKHLQTSKAISLLKVITDMIIRCTASWTQQAQLFVDKCEFLALLTITIKSNSIGDICKLCWISTSGVKPTNKELSSKKEDPVEYFLESLQPYQIMNLE